MEKSNNIYSAACNVSGGSLPDGTKITLHLEIDFEGISANQERQWAGSSRIIALQRNLRTLPLKTLEDMALDTVRVHASQCGMKVESKEEIMAKAHAVIAMMDPEAKKELLDKIAKMDKE